MPEVLKNQYVVIVWRGGTDGFWEYFDAFTSQVYEMSSVKNNWGRMDLLRDWQEGGGIMIIGYELYRILTTHQRVKNKKQKKAFTETLSDPGN